MKNREEIIANTSVDMIEKIAAKLHNDGLTADNYNIESSNRILENTCLPTKLKIMNEEFSDVVLYYMRKLESL